jgi:hypothetical protein
MAEQLASGNRTAVILQKNINHSTGNLPPKTSAGIRAQTARKSYG